jgi:ubiquinone/menaquinone biosynthesis C-methylase UbiE
MVSQNLESNKMLLSEAWDKEALRWADWARRPGHDSYWRFHRDQFFQLVPAPGMLTVDIGCGEGRLTRHLQSLGHKTIGIDVSETLIRLACEEDSSGKYLAANAAELPLENECADLAVAFMTMQDIDDLQSAINEAARILIPGGRLIIAIVHPINSSGTFATEEPDSKFVINANYFNEFRYSDTFSRDGLEMTFHSQHRPIDSYSRALENAGFLIEALREHPVPDSAADRDTTKRWQRLPLFLHLRCLKK